MGVENKRGEKRQWNPYPLIQLVMERAKVGIKEARSPNPNPLIGHHNCATKWHKAIPTVCSDAVIITRSEGTLWSEWCKHTSWLGLNKRTKEVKPDGHGETTHGHELYLHELASINSMIVVP
jgi:hypothetical protein